MLISVIKLPRKKFHCLGLRAFITIKHYAISSDDSLKEKLNCLMAR